MAATQEQDFAGHDLVPVQEDKAVDKVDKEEKAGGKLEKEGVASRWFAPSQIFGFCLGVLLWIIFVCVELDDAYPLANDMLALSLLVGCFWVFQVLPLPVTSLLPIALMPFQGITTSKAAASSYWNWIQMLFLGAFIVDGAIMHVNLHRRIALKVLLKVGVRYPWIVVLAFMSISYFLSMWCSNTATTVMLMPFAKGLLDTALEKNRADIASADFFPRAENGQKYTVAVLLGIAYGATCGGIATVIGTPPNGVLAGMEIVNESVTSSNWISFAFPSSFLLFLLSFSVVYLMFARGVTLELDNSVLIEQYEALGPLNRDEVVVAVVQLLQIFGWFIRVDVINDPEITGEESLKGVNDATIACGAAVLLFFVPSSKRPGEMVFTWDAAERHLPWGVLLLMGGGYAIAGGFSSSKLTAYVGEQLAEAANMHKLGLTYLITSCICFLTEVTSNTATANVMLPILASVATKTLTHPLALMVPATVGCSLAFMLPAATPPNSVVFATGLVKIQDFVKAGLTLNVIAIILVSPLVYLLGVAVYDIEGPFPKTMCIEPLCKWVPVAGEVLGQQVTGQACAVLKEGGDLCELHDGTLFNFTVS